MISWFKRKQKGSEELSTLGAENALIQLMDEQMKALAEEMNRQSSPGKYVLTLAERMKAMGSIQDWLMKRRRLLGEEGGEGDESVGLMQQNAELLRTVARQKERLDMYEPPDGGPPLQTYRPKGGRPSKADVAAREKRKQWLQDTGMVPPDDEDEDDSSDLDRQLAKLKGN